MGTLNIEEILYQMIIEEKASLCSGADFWHTEAVERLGLPAAMVSDGPHGLRKQDETADHLGAQESIKAVCFPTASAMACSFDRELIYNVGSALGEECQAENVNVLLGPGINMKRSPLCGRNFEYYSEDPLISGICAAADTRGVQRHLGCGTTIKHFALNNQEDNRSHCNSHCSERAIREIYLKGFEIAVKESAPLSLMTSYNLLNGLHTANHKELLTDILRSEWGFDGLVMTDWGTTGGGDMNPAWDEKYGTSDPVECICSGNDLIMPGSQEDFDAIVNAVGSKLKLSELQICAKRVLALTALRKESEQAKK